MSDEASEAFQHLDSLIGQLADTERTVTTHEQLVAAAIAKATKEALEEHGDTITASLADAERLRGEIFDSATKYRSLLADGKDYIAVNNGTVKWHTTKTWEIDVNEAKLLTLIRRLRAVRFVVTVKRTVSKERLNQNPWIWKLLEKLRAAHLQKTTTFAIAPVGYKSNPKNDPNKLVANSETIHEE